jgi:uncharacterized membrane protein YeiH
MDLGDSSALIFSTASVVGGIAFAISGFMTGIRKNLDLMGIFVLSFLSANGGGVIRDLLVDRTPAIMSSTIPFWLTAVSIAGAIAFRLQNGAVEQRRIFVVSDAIGLAAFGIHGALIGIDAGLHWFGVITLSFLTATGGGMIRDMLVNEVPMVLHEDFYGSVALLLALAVYGLHQAGEVGPLSLIAVFVAGVALRLYARKRGWRLPKVRPNVDLPS